MSPKRALQLALNLLKPFQEAGNIYEDYIDHEGITDAEFGEMLATLESLSNDGAMKHP